MPAARIDGMTSLISTAGRYVSKAIRPLASGRRQHRVAHQHFTLPGAAVSVSTKLKSLSWIARCGQCAGDILAGDDLADLYRRQGRVKSDPPPCGSNH